MVSIADATTYIEANLVSSEDWTDADDAKKTRLLNVAVRELTDFCDDKILTQGGSITNYQGYLVQTTPKITSYTLPNEAVYEYAAALATVFNDTNKMQQQGIAGFSVTGVGSFTFKPNLTSSVLGLPLQELIPNTAKKLIDKANKDLSGYKPVAGRGIGWLV
jgi:hypothetical protein